MAWRLQGSYLENCNCDSVCPCLTSAFTRPGDRDRCNALLLFHIGSGEVEGTDVGDLNVGLVVDSPPLMGAGDWRVGVVMDAAANEEQAGALAAVFSGDKDGPPAALGPLIGEMMGVETVPIEYADDGSRHSVKIGNDMEIEMEDFTPEGGREPSRPTGIGNPVSSTFTIAPATKARGSLFGLPFGLDGGHGVWASFSWSG
jgi:hypothetical protein